MQAFVQIPIDWVRNPSLSRVAQLLYPLLQSYANHKPPNGWYVGAYPGLRRLSRDLHCSHRKVRSALQELAKVGLVHWRLGSGRRSTQYKLRAQPRSDHWIQIPVTFLRSDLKVGPKLTYLAINTFDVWGGTGEGAYPRQTQLQDILRCPDTTLRRWLSTLRETGLLSIEDDGQYVLMDTEHFCWNGVGEFELI